MTKFAIPQCTWLISHNTPILYTTMHHFVPEICTCMCISVTNGALWLYLCNVVWDLWDWSTYRKWFSFYIIPWYWNGTVSANSPIKRYGYNWHLFLIAYMHLQMTWQYIRSSFQQACQWQFSCIFPARSTRSVISLRRKIQRKISVFYIIFHANIAQAI